MKFRAALAAALLGPGLALCGCGAQSTQSTTTSSSSTAPSTSTSTTSEAVTTTASPTVTTSTHTVVGTTPLHTTVTETSTELTTTPAGPDGVAVESGAPLGETSTTNSGQTIDGVECNRLDQLAYQTYAHLQVYVQGHPRALPGAIGLVRPHTSQTGTTTTYAQGLCSYWVRTVAANGVIEVRSPVPESFTLADLFDIWSEPLTASDVAGIHGKITATVNGHVWRGNPRTIPLREHESIQLAVGRPVPRFQPVDWSVTDL